MDPMRSPYEALDSSISAELLQITLAACKAGLFYRPMRVGSDDTVQFESNAFDRSWVLNIGALYGLPEEPKDTSELLSYVYDDDREKLTQVVMKAITEQISENDCEYRIIRPDGEIRWLLSRILIGLNSKGEPRYLASMCFDITEQKLAQEHLERSNVQLEQAQKFLHAALSASGIAIFRHAIDRQASDLGSQDYNTWNFNLSELYGYPPGTLMTPELRDRRMKKEDIAAIQYKISESLTTGRHDCQYEYPIQWEDQSKRWLLAKYTTEFDGRGKPQYVSGAVVDITDRKQAEEQTNFMATHDMLTELPNRFMFSNLLKHTIETAKRYSNRFAVFFIDLDRFKAINDALGHQAGDQLLVGISDRLLQCLRSSDVLARISGDEFVLLAPGLDSEDGAAVLARKIIADVSKPIDLYGHKCQVTASIGICLYPDHGTDEETLIKHADSAMYIAKEAGKNNYQFFNALSTSQSLERMALENELRAALGNGELYLEYQAKLNLRNDEISGVEALLRWENEQFGNVSPARFIPVAEETGLIVPIGRWVLMAACRQNVEWQRQGMQPICVSVNISARQFLSKDLLEHIKEALEETGMAPELLELEITESMVMHHVEEALAQLFEIKKLGARIAIDDFGTGYSSLAQLKRFPIDTLKVDRSFISEVAHNLEDQAITEAIIEMGRSMSLTITAEGVETKEQQEFLRRRACDEIQGYYFSRPVAPSEFSKFFHGHNL